MATNPKKIVLDKSIDESNIKKLFDPKYQVDPKTGMAVLKNNENKN